MHTHPFPLPRVWTYIRPEQRSPGRMTLPACDDWEMTDAEIWIDERAPDTLYQNNTHDRVFEAGTRAQKV